MLYFDSITITAVGCCDKREVLKWWEERKESKARIEQGRRKLGRGHWSRRGVHNRSRFYPVCYFSFVSFCLYQDELLLGPRNPSPPLRSLSLYWELWGI